MPRALGFALLAVAPQVCFAQTASHWYAGAGIALTDVRPVDADYRVSGTSTRFSKSDVTFPHLFAGYRFDRLAIEGGYRKLAVVDFETADGANRGDTHSNAVYAAALMPLGTQRSFSLYSRASANLVRTVTQFERRSATYPIEGNANHWTFVPAVGLGLALTPARAWTVRAEYEFYLLRIGDAARTGRSRQSHFSLSVVYNFGGSR